MPMSVHIDELHSDVAPVRAVPGDATEARMDPPWTADERWREERDRAAWLARRVAAVDFDD
jgi:hypothetical protein